MKAVILALVVCALPLTARADGPCKVTYVTVPDGIREVIEGWVAAEPHCRGTIALRVIPTKDGLFLFAERPDGTVHERLVPDLTAAGVLVASWVSDSWNERPRKKRRHHDVAVPTTTVDDERLTIKAETPRSAASVSGRFISLGGAFVTKSDGADLGFRLEGDLLAYGGWRLGVTVQKVEANIGMYGDYGGEYRGQIDDYSIGGYVARVLRYRGWEMRGTFGLYAMGSRLHRDDFSNIALGGMQLLDYQIEPTSEFELSASLSRDLGERWAISVTAAMNSFTQTWSGPMSVSRSETQNIWVASLRRRI